MFNTMHFQIQYLLGLQNLREVTHGIFDNFFMSATYFGEYIIPLSILALIYWGINKRAGRFILFTYGITLWVNVFLKMTACIKRPWLIDSSIKPVEKAMPAADGYSFPSGHTAGAMAVWGSIAFLWWKNKILRYAMITIVLLVAFSRNYIGVHTPQDVIVSIIAGIFIILGVDVVTKITDKNKNADIIFFAVMMFLTLLLCIYIQIKCNIQMQNYNPLTDNLNPLEMKHSVYSKISFIIGIFSGWILEKRFVDFKIPENEFVKKAIYLPAGIICLYVILRYLTGFILPFVPEHIAYAIVWFIAAMFITFLYPVVIKMICSNDKQD